MTRLIWCTHSFTTPSLFIIIIQMPLSSQEQYSLDAINSFAKSPEAPSFPVTPMKQITVA